MRRHTLFLFVCLIVLAGRVHAQESQLHAEFRHESEKLKASCAKFGLKSFPGCAEVLFTGHPLHIAVGSIAPGNGFGAGPAFVTHYTPNETWRLSWNVDAVGSNNGSWRAGGYMNAIYIKPRKVIEERGRHSSNPQ